MCPMSPTNKQLIRMHLEELLREQGYKPGEASWGYVLAYCSGYYDKITLDHVTVLTEMVKEGILAEVK